MRSPSAFPGDVILDGVLRLGLLVCVEPVPVLEAPLVLGIPVFDPVFQHGDALLLQALADSSNVLGLSVVAST